MIKYDEIRMFHLELGNAFRGIKKFRVIIDKDTFQINDNLGHKKDINFNEIDEIKEFFYNLKLLALEDWKDVYISNKKINDPSYWKIVLKFNDGHYVEYRGVEEYPINWDKVVKLVSRYSYFFEVEE